MPHAIRSSRRSSSEIVSLESVEAFRRLAPHAEFVDVTGAGHMVAGDQNDTFTAAVLTFLSEVRTGTTRR